MEAKVVGCTAEGSRYRKIDHVAPTVRNPGEGIYFFRNVPGVVLAGRRQIQRSHTDADSANGRVELCRERQRFFRPARLYRPLLTRHPRDRREPIK